MTTFLKQRKISFFSYLDFLNYNFLKILKPNKTKIET